MRFINNNTKNPLVVRVLIFLLHTTYTNYYVNVGRFWLSAFVEFSFKSTKRLSGICIWDLEFNLNSTCIEIVL